MTRHGLGVRGLGFGVSEFGVWVQGLGFGSSALNTGVSENWGYLILGSL